MSTPPYGGILVVDPNGLRASLPGPRFFLLDSLRLKPGLTNKSGAFQATINDNKNGNRVFDMTLFVGVAPLIEDNDEFWVGIISGNDGLPNDETGLQSNWAPETGGRAWIMGGFICNRDYEYDKTTRVTAILGGTDYMEEWRKIPVGTLDQPLKYVMPQGAYSAADFGYTRPIELYKLFETILLYVNSQQAKDYRYTPCDDYFPASTSNQGATVDGSDTIYRRQFSGDPTEIDAFTLMEMLCEAAGMEWQIVPDPENQQWGYASPTAYWRIDGTPSDIKLEGTGRPEEYGGVFQSDWRFVGKAGSRRMLLVYPRKSDGCATVYDAGYQMIEPPTVGKVAPNWVRREASSFDYDVVLDYTLARDFPKIMVEDLTNLATNVMVSGDSAPTFPANRTAWINPALWIDADDATWKYNFLSLPLPPNPYSSDDAKWADRSLIWDDEDWPAIVFRKWGPNARSDFLPMLGFHPALLHQPWLLRQYQYRVDAREFRHLEFKFRHPGHSAGATYRVRLHSDIGNQPYDEWASNYYYHDFTILDGDWTGVDLLLPEILASGDYPGFTINDLNGWVAVGTPDVTKLDWLSFDVHCAETDPGSVVVVNGEGTWRFMVKLPIITWHAGSPHLRIPQPEKYFLVGEFGGLSYQGQVQFLAPQPTCYIGNDDFSVYEVVRVDAMNNNFWVDSTGAEYNLRLSQALKNSYTSCYLYIPSGLEICVSQLRFTRSDVNERRLVSQLSTEQTYPKRYRTVKYTDAKYNGELEDRISQEILRSRPQQSLTVNIDGNLLFHIGFQVPVDLGATSVFHDINMMIDDLTYVVEGVDFYMEVTLGPSEFDRRSYTYNISSLQGAVIRKIVRDEVGRTTTKGTETRDVT